MRGPRLWPRLWLGTWAKFLLGWRLGPYVPTPPHVVASMLRLAELSPVAGEAAGGREGGDLHFPPVRSDATHEE